jgi:uncharacterized protein (DUF885 family)
MPRSLCRLPLLDKHANGNKVSAPVVLTQMTHTLWRNLGLSVVFFAAGSLPLVANNAPQAPQPSVVQAAPDQVPADLNPLLLTSQSEMRLVVQRYSMDRSTLAGNFLAGGGRAGGGGRGGRGGGQPGAPTAAPAPAPAAPAFTVSLSPNRIARLKRFDLDWQTALGAVNASTLSQVAQAELATLKTTVATNLQQLEADTASIASVAPTVPFAADIIAIVELRMRMGDMDAQASAGVVDKVTKHIARTRAALEAGLAAGPLPTSALRVSGDQARAGADAVDALRANMTEWFNHYNTFDPLFSWWMPQPWGELDKAFVSYASFLRETIAPANLPSSTNIAPAVIAPGAAPAISSVPNLAEIIALPHDEMTPVVQRFMGNAGGGRGRGAAPARGTDYYTRWLTALKTLDFDRLSRNAQVDYLFIKKRAELEIARANAVAQTNIPRKMDNSGIEGAARGRDGLIIDLADEMIPYSPEELIRLGEREFAWTVAEMEKASKAMGLGSDWGAAVEKVKNMYVQPGRQPEMVRDLLFEAIDYLRAKDLITVPSVASESLRMVMLSPERQLTAPFFLGGSQILVAYPTNTMAYDTRMQALRGNNRFFSNAVAHHEMIPGHNLVGFLGQRFNGYRAGLGSTPFLGEGWPLYWETILYDKGFHDSPEKKVGALFWRMHRAARIVFSLKFHMGQWSPQECINFLVNEVGHERDNATAEVRRSFGGQYGPLYQMAYLVGGLQIRGMKREIVDSGMRTEKDFHDEIMRQGSMPVAFLRLAVSKQPLTRDMVVDWKFYGDLSGGK